MHVMTLALVIATLAVGCGAPQPSQSSVISPSSSSSPAPKRITAAVQSSPNTLNSQVNPPGAGFPGLDVLETLVSSQLSAVDDQGNWRPQLAEAVPSLENGLWKLLPDSRMETTWTIREGAVWHDGAPFSTDDLVFTAVVSQDKDLDIIPNVAYESLDGIDVAGPRTVTARWRRPFIRADTWFDTSPLPKHLLQKAYAEDKVSFTQLPYWTEAFVGAGPFKIRQFVAGSHVLLDANERYVLGRPKIDEIEVRFIGDPSTLAANILAGTVDLTLGRSLSLEQALQVGEQWKEGKAEIALSGWIVIFPQFMNPTPATLVDVRMRRAFLHAIDRQQMADTLMSGQVPIAHTFLSPDRTEYIAIEPSVVKYEYDNAAAMRLFQALGYAKGADGLIRDGAGRPLEIQIRATAGRDLNNKAMFAIADYWQRLGITTEPYTLPQQRQRDREYVQTFPGFILYNQPADINSLNRLRINQTPLPENSYVGNNNSRYINLEFEALIDRYFTTIPQQERTTVLGQVVHHMTDVLNMIGIFHNAEPAMVANRLQGVGSRRGEGPTSQSWNAHEWDLRN